MKKNWMKTSIISILLCMMLITLTSCQKMTSTDHSKNSTDTTEYEQIDPSSVDSEHTLGQTGDAQSEQKAFDAWCKEQFTDSMENADTITLHYMLEDPEKYGIQEGEIGFGDISVEEMKKDRKENEQCLKELSTFDYSMLSDAQQVTYGALHFYLKCANEEDDYSLYGNALSPDLGIPANVPVELNEYPLRSKEDVDTYLTLLTKLPDYFAQLAAYEKEVSDAGLFISDDTLKDTLKQMREFIRNPEENYLITTFEARLDAIDGLSRSQKSELVKTNQKNVKEYIIPAYETLIKEISALKGTGKNNGGLCNFEKGKQYYEYLAKYYTCSDMSVDEIMNILEERVDTLMSRLQKIIRKDVGAVSDYEDLKYTLKDPDEILTHLQKQMKPYFPECPKVSYTVKHVDPSLAESLSPAFFMVPQIDNYEENTIYINDKSSSFDSNDLYSTLAHEGFPGHLYQTAYYNSTNPEPIRQMLNFGGYSEGWATYVELSSYELIDFGENDTDITDICQIESELSLALSSIVDIGVNHKNWNKNKISTYLEDYGMGGKETVDQLYTLVVEDPGNYLQYYVSYLEFWNLRCKAKAQLKDQFDLKAFHKVILDCGPAPFSVMETQVDKYINNNR